MKIQNTEQRSLKRDANKNAEQASSYEKMETDNKTHPEARP